MKLPIQTTLLILAAAALLLLADAWRSARRDSQQLALTLAAQNSVIQQAGEQQKQRDSQLNSVLAAIQAQKRAIRTPEQAAQKLPEALPLLPLPIAIHIPALSAKPIYPPSRPSGTSGKSTSPTTDDTTGENSEVSISIPRPDLIPLYNDLQDCRATQLQTTALTKDLADEKARSAALLQERNAAVTAARGGSLLQHLKRASKWFAIGLAIGAALTATHRH